MSSGWGEPSEPSWRRRPSVPPWMLVGALILVGLAIAFHGSSGGALRAQLAAWLGNGTVSVPATAPVRPSITTQFSTLSDGLSQLTRELPKGEWLNADASLGILQGTWNTLAGQLVKEGVTVGVINGFSTGLSDLAAAVNTQDTARASQDVSTLQANLKDMQSAYVSLAKPSGFVQLETLSQQLSADVQAKNWTAVTKDAAQLQGLVQKFQKGF